MKVGLEMKEIYLLQVQSYLKDDDGFLSKKNTGFTNLFVSMVLKRLQVDSEGEFRTFCKRGSQQ